MLLSEFIETYFEVHVAVHNKLSTTISKRQMLRTSIVPLLGHRPLEQLSRADFVVFIAGCHKLGFKPKTINNHLTCLRNLLTIAYDMELIRNIPTIKRVHLVKTDRRSLTPAESIAFCTATEEPFWEAFVRLVLCTGLRIGELRALKWENVKLRGLSPTIRIVATCAGKRSEIGTPKSGRNRTVPLNIEAVEVLKWLQVKSTYEFVMSFPGSHLDSEVPMNYRRCERFIGRARKAAGIKWLAGWHTLRHTFASNLAGARQSLVHIKELLGHADISTTMKYAHLLPSDLISAVNALPRILPPKA